MQLISTTTEIREKGIYIVEHWRDMEQDEEDQNFEVEYLSSSPYGVARFLGLTALQIDCDPDETSFEEVASDLFYQRVKELSNDERVALFRENIPLGLYFFMYHSSFPFPKELYAQFLFYEGSDMGWDVYYILEAIRKDLYLEACLYLVMSKPCTNSVLQSFEREIFEGIEKSQLERFFQVLMTRQHTSHHYQTSIFLAGLVSSYRLSSYLEYVKSTLPSNFSKMTGWGREEFISLISNGELTPRFLEE